MHVKRSLQAPEAPGHVARWTRKRDLKFKRLEIRTEGRVLSVAKVEDSQAALKSISQKHLECTGDFSSSKGETKGQIISFCDSQIAIFSNSQLASPKLKCTNVSQAHLAIPNGVANDLPH